MKIYSTVFVTFFAFIVSLVQIRAQTPTELVQGAQGMSPLDYYELSLEAHQHFEGRDYAAAANAFRQLTKSYPYNGENWLRFAQSLHRIQKFKEAARAFAKAQELGLPRASHWNAVDVAESYARAGDVENALSWLEKANRQFRFGARSSLMKALGFASLKDNPRFLELIGATKREFTRNEGWRYDVDYLLSEIKRLNPVHSKQPLPDELVQAARRLKAQIPKLSDAQVLFEMEHLLALLQQAHNGLDFDTPGKIVKLTQLPLTFYAFPEGLYIVDAKQPYEDLIGSRVLRFDDTTAEKALEATKYIIGRENEMALLWGGPDRLKLVQFLHAMKLTRNPDRVNITVIDREGKTRTVSPDPVALSRGPKLNAPRIPNLPPPPLYLTRPDDQYWFEYLSKEKTLYLQFNQVSEKKEEPLLKFGLRVRDFLAKNDVRNLIVDVRRNNGGSTFYYSELLRTLIGFDLNKENTLVVFTGRNTFSAASNFITDVDRLTNAVFVGEPSSSTPLMIGGDENEVPLPYSGISAFIASTSWALTTPRDTRQWVAIDIPVSLTAKDYFANRDPLMETVTALIESGKLRKVSVRERL